MNQPYDGHGRNGHPGHPVWTPLLILVVALILLIAFAYLNLAEYVFRLLGLSPLGAFLVLGGSLLGSMVNIPLTRRRIKLVDPRVAAMPSWLQWMLPIVHYYPPATVEQVVAINVGGAVVPLVWGAQESKTALPGSHRTATSEPEANPDPSTSLFCSTTCISVPSSSLTVVRVLSPR